MMDTAISVTKLAVRSGTKGAPIAAAAGTAVVFRRGLFDLLEQAGRVTLVSAPAGSGKTVLLRSWVCAAALTECAVWVPVQGERRDPQQFWVSIADALRGTTAGAELVRPLTAAPDLDGWAVVERLLDDLAPLREQIWLILDDLHELGCDTTLAQLELLVQRAPPELRFVFATRHDPRLALHRLRLEGGLTEIRAANLRFTTDEARALLRMAGVELAEPALALLVERTEGWAAGLRLAALSLAGHDDPERFAAEFCGSERTVAEYLLAEVLDRQSTEVRRLLLRTSVLERVTGELADLLTGGSGAEWVLQQLEEANAFVVSLDARRSWFRYHHLFADLLQMELRRIAPEEVSALHQVAAGWFADRGFAVEAIRHAHAVGDWELAARLLAGHWTDLHLGGHDATVHALLAGFPAEIRATDAEVAAVVAADELARGSLETAELYLELAARAAASVPTARSGQWQVLLGVVRLLVARQCGNLPAAAEEARQLQAAAEAPDAAQPGLGEDLRALALVNLGITEIWTSQLSQAQAHLEQGVALARRIGRPYLEFTGLAYQAPLEFSWSLARAADCSAAAVELARRHGWTDDPAAGIAYIMLASALVWQGRPEEAERWVQRAERTVRPDAQPAAGLAVCCVRGLLEVVRGCDQQALAAFQAADQLAGLLAAPHLLVPRARAQLLLALLRTGQTERAEKTLADLDDQDRDRGEVRIATAALRLARRDPRAASAALAPVLDGSAPVSGPTWLVQAFLLEATARDALGNPAAAEHAVERALTLAEQDRPLTAFILQPAPGLLQRHARVCAKHAGLITDILRLLPDQHAPQTASFAAGQEPAQAAPPLQAITRLTEPISPGESRVLRYLPTNLSTPEIARELSLSINTVRTHTRHVFAKLGVHRRTDAVTRARALGLLTPSPCR
jgi:LuxR family transcriptional regulator, maltose regulon positive regulatory protein